MKTLDLVYFNAGGGHRAAAVALEMAIREQGWPWRTRLVNLFEVLDPRDVFRKTTGMKPEQYYNARLARGWTLGLAQELKVLQALIRLSHKSLSAQLREHWRQSQPDMVVSLVPNFNRAMFQALAMARPQAPYVTIMTDFADLPPHFWIEPSQKQHWICGTKRAVQQALAAGCPPRRVHSVSGMIINPDFYRDSPIERDAEMRRLGLDPSRPTGMVMFGGHGSRVMRGLAKRLQDVQLIFVCGHNAALAQQLRRIQSRAPRIIMGFTTQMRSFMRLCDFLIGKPGPGSISEALQQGLPVVVVRNAWTMPQERYNAEWVEENQVGLVLESYRDAPDAVRHLSEHLTAYRRQVRAIQIRAVFQIPALLDTLLMSPARVGIDLVQHFRSAEGLHLS